MGTGIWTPRAIVSRVSVQTVEQRWHIMTKWYDNIPAPMDANDREIPLDTKVLYNKDGNEFFVDRATYMRVAEEWCFFGHFGSHTDTHRILDSDLYLTPTDSLEKLERDLCSMLRGGSCACRYFGNGTSIDCDGCPADNSAEGSCINEAARDILRRAKELAERDTND